MFFLAISILAYLIGPLVYQLSRQSAKGLSLLDGFVFASIGGLALFHFTGLVDSENVLMLSMVLIFGLFFPNVLEKTFRSYNRQIHLSVIALGVAGFLLHVFLESAMIRLSEDLNSFQPLMYGIVIHRFPVGLAIWWVLRPRFGNLFAVFAIFLLALANLCGFFLGEGLSHDNEAILYLQTFLTGSILHVVFFNSHVDGKLRSSCCHCESSAAKQRNYEGLGNILGLVFLLLMSFLIEDQHLHDHHNVSFTESFLDLFYLSAPALLIAYFLSGLLKSFVSIRSLAWFNKGSRLSRATKGVVFGLPLPVCSCGVLPFYKTLADKGLAPAAALSFLIATPELGLDAILISFPLLGKELTIVRVLAAFILALLIGVFLSPLLKAKAALGQDLSDQLPKKQKLLAGFKFSFTKLVDDTAPWILAGILLAAFFHALIGEIQISFFGNYDLILAALIGIVVYVCASGATPVVAVLLAAGLSPGAAIVFLLTGPATNISTFGVLSEAHGKKFAFLFAAVTFVIAITLGFLVNLFFPEITFLPELSEHGHEQASYFSHIVAGLVLIIILSSLYRNGARKFCGLG